MLQSQIREKALGILSFIFSGLTPKTYKGWHEFGFWRRRYQEEQGKLTNDHYEFFYTTFFSLDKYYYEGRRVLDIGCGPRGSLEWATGTNERTGLDPLTEQYRQLGIDQHAMDYVEAPSENMPFEDGRFDIVCSFNSLDHVDDLEKTISEIKRVCRRGGLFLLITEVNHEATGTEPQEFGFEIADRFLPEFSIVQEGVYGLSTDHDIYGSIKAELPYNRNDSERNAAILCAKFERC